MEQNILLLLSAHKNFCTVLTVFFWVLFGIELLLSLSEDEKNKNIKLMWTENKNLSENIHNTPTLVDLADSFQVQIQYSQSLHQSLHQVVSFGPCTLFF